MSGYELWKFLHIVGAIVWLGAGVTLYLQFAYLGMQRDSAGLLKMTRMASWMGPRLFAPAAIATLVFGIIMVLTEDGLAFSDPFITIGFAGIIASLIIGNGLTESRAKRYLEIAEEEGPDAPALAAIGQQIGTYSLVDLIVLFFVVWAMVAQPRWWG
ncbi:MAG: DUF2269 domain-containing protein [Actinobacteria bacterium]|nr:DUF2269 domain-containing protein [Actinomycetota bacterium]